jgi:hypothetical protein
LSGKKGHLGMFTQQVGTLRVVRVKQDVSVALVGRTCDSILLGDLLRAPQQAPATVVGSEMMLDRFAEPSGKQRGRIVLARDGRELVSGSGRLHRPRRGGQPQSGRPPDDLQADRDRHRHEPQRHEIAHNKSRGFESERFRGGKYSINAQRVKDPVGGEDSLTNTLEVKRRRPQLPRKIVGEMIVIGVETRTAKAVITQTAQEIHTGDYVEVQ